MAHNTSGDMHFASSPSNYKLQNSLLLLVAGLGGLLYGVDVGIIGGALPYLEATSGLSAGQLSVIVAAVLLGSVISTLFAGLLADWMGRRPLMTLSGILFVLSIPVIALSHGYGPLFLVACCKALAVDSSASSFHCISPSAWLPQLAVKARPFFSGC